MGCGSGLQLSAQRTVGLVLAGGWAVSWKEAGG